MLVLIDTTILICLNRENNLEHINKFVVSLLLKQMYANDSSQICPFLAVRTQFDSDHHQNPSLSSHSYSHESVIYFYFFY